MKNKTKKSYFVKPVLLSVLMGVSLTACNSGTAPGQIPGASAKTTLMNSALKSDNEVGVRLGSPAVNMAPQGQPVDINALSQIIYLKDFNKTDEVSMGNPTTKIQYKQNLTSEQILKELGIDGSLKGSYKDLSGDFAAKYLDQAKSSSNELTLTLSASSFAQISLDKKYSLDEEEKDLGVSTIGDSYVSVAQGGLSVEATIHVKFANTTAKNNVMASGKIDYSSIVNLVGSLNMLDEQTKNQISIEVELIQRGGDSENITNTLTILTKDANGEIIEAPFFLSSVSLANADKLIDAVQGYISKPQESTPSEFQKQIHEYMADGRNIKVSTVKDTQKLFFSGKGLSARAYSASIPKYVPDVELRKAIAAHDQEFSDLIKLSSQYAKYRDVLTDYANSFPSSHPEALRLAEKNKDDLNKLSVSFIEDAKQCYGLVTTPTDVQECITTLNIDSANANKLNSDLNGQKWNTAYLLRSSTKPGGLDKEYLIPLGGEGTKQYFVTYSASPADASYAPGSIYSIDTDKQLTNVIINRPYTESVVAKSYKVSASLANDFTSYETMELKNIAYKNLDGVTTTPSTGTELNNFLVPAKMSFN